MGLSRIATAEIDRADAMKRFMSFERLRATRGDANGPLQRIIAWFKSEDALNFSTSHMRLGRANDDYVVLYYFEGMRWKIMFIPAKTDGRRWSDMEYGYIHPCSSFPASDLEVEVPAEYLNL